VDEYSATMKVEKEVTLIRLVRIIDFFFKKHSCCALVQTQKLEWVETIRKSNVKENMIFNLVF